MYMCLRCVSKGGWNLTMSVRNMLLITEVNEQVFYAACGGASRQDVTTALSRHVSDYGQRPGDL